MATAMATTTTSRWLLLGALVTLSVSLQGCSLLDAPKHNVGNWQQKDSYLNKFEVAPLSSNKNASATLNSCNSKDITVGLKCNGHGSCKEWVALQMGDVQKKRLSFCECDMYFGDPECGTQKRSQVTAFLLSIAFGWLGLDQFYLGYMWYGFFKLITVGGLGLWYIYDIVRIGSANVLTADSFKLANDLPHGAFVLILVMLMGFLGFAVTIVSIYRERRSKAREVLLYRADEESMKRVPVAQQSWMRPMSYFQGPSIVGSQASSRQPSYVPAVQQTFSGYGTTMGAGKVV